MLTPAQVHYGHPERVLAARRRVLAAYGAQPERFVRGVPQPNAPAAAVWIKPPASTRPPATDVPNLSVTQPGAGTASRAAALFPRDGVPVGGYPADGSARPPITTDAP